MITHTHLQESNCSYGFEIRKTQRAHNKKADSPLQHFQVCTSSRTRAVGPGGEHELVFLSVPLAGDSKRRPSNQGFKQRFSEQNVSTTSRILVLQLNHKTKPCKGRTPTRTNNICYTQGGGQRGKATSVLERPAVDSPFRARLIERITSNPKTKL
jgi:hypothetical protein